MNHAGIRLRTVPFALLLLLSCYRPLAAQELDSMLNAVHRLQLQNFLAINAFYNYSANPDPALLRDITASVDQADKLIQIIAERREGLIYEPVYLDLVSRLQQFKELMNTNIIEVQKNGYADLRLVSDLAGKSQELNAQAEIAYRASAERTDAATDRPVEAIREATLMLARMMSQYSAFSSSNVAQIFQGATNAGGPIDQQARSFDRLMAELISSPVDTETMAALDRAHSTWGFIRASYINYNERNVSFVINRYSKTIIDNLVSAIPGPGKA